jgi:hypothetical protein
MPVYPPLQLKLDISGREITAGQRTMSGQNAELSRGQILTLPVILTAHFR